MADANIWNPGATIPSTAVNADNTRKVEVFTAAAGQVDFTLSTFTYIPGTGSLEIFINGISQALTYDYIETSISSFRLVEGAEAGDQVKAVGYVGVSGDATLGAAVQAAQAAQVAAELAETNAEAAAIAAAAAEVSIDLFNTTYLGAKAADPALDNEGNPLIDGAMYWNTVTKELKTYDLATTTWAGITKPGKQTIWIPARGMESRSTNGAAAGLVETTTNKIMISTLNFDPATIEYSQFVIGMPKGWNEGTLTARFRWSNASGTGDVIWGLQAVAVSDDDVIDAAFGTAVEVTDSVTAVGDVMLSAETAAMTVAGTPAAEDLVYFQVYRKATAAGDTLAVDARLHGVTLYYTTDAANDA